MDTKQVILELRTQKGMSQDELAEKVFVSRQTVVEIKNDLIRTMGECRDVTDQYSETTFQKIVDFERSFLLCLIAGTGNLHG